MKYKSARFTLGLLVVIIVVFLGFNRSSPSTFLYKNYTLRYDRGWDILCDPYVVKKNDWVYKLFRQRGEIAHNDFPEFLRIFKRINPHIRDINRIRPGQRVLIPLKKLNRNEPLEEFAEAVTIPFVTASKPAETKNLHQAKYKVKKGDSISVLIAKRFGAFGTESYEQGIKLFRLANPDVENLDHIYSGQMILIPDPTVQRKQQDLSFFVGSKNKITETGVGSLARIHETDSELLGSASSGRQPNAPLDEIAWALDAKLVNRGTYYLPRRGQEDFAIDLSTLPFLELTNGNRIFFPLDHHNQGPEIHMIRSFWGHMNIVRMSPNDPVGKILGAIFGSEEIYVSKKNVSFSDRGVGVEVRGNWIIDTFADEGKTVRHHCITLIDSPLERTATSVARYLDQNNIIIKEIIKGSATIPQNINEPQYKFILEDVVRIDTSDRMAFVDQLTTALGFHYAPNVGISFPYAGIQVQTVSNLLVKDGGDQFLVDFGELYGDSVQAIEKTGLNIIQLKKEDNLPTIIKKLIRATGLSYSDSPTFLAANRPAHYNTTMRIPGFFITGEDEHKILLSLVPLHDGLINFLFDKGINVIMIGSTEEHGLKPA